MPDLDVERQWDTERVSQRLRQMLELVGHMDRDDHVTVSRERDPVRNVRYELGVVEVSRHPVLLRDLLLLAFSVR